MSIFDDFFDFVDDTFDDIGDVLEDTWKGIKSNPIGAITSVVAMSMGIPPMWAGALAGGVGAAATGGDVLKGAFTGGAMGYMGAQAGAATGSLGPIAQAAAMGATSAATGAVLTGQDVLTAVKSGLILGGVSGGIAQLMTPSEAIAQVPKDKLAEIYATGQDPLGDLIKQQGWTDSDSARAAASQVFSKNSATTIAQLQAAVPDYVLKEAQSIAKTGNPQQYINEQMGWTDNGLTNSAATKALDTYMVANKAVNRFGPNNELAPVTDAVSRTPLEIKTNDIVSTGLVDAADASVLANGGYTATDVQNLIKAGYAATDLADMAATGVPASTLTSLSNTQFTEGQINGLLTGRVSANDIASANNLVNAGKLNVTTAESLMAKGINSIDLGTIAKSGKADAFNKLMDSGVSKSNAQYMLDRGVDLNKAVSAIDSGKITGQQLDQGVGTNTYNKLINDAMAAPVAPTEAATKPAGPVNPSSANQIVNNIPTIDEMWAKYDASDAFNPTSSSAADIQNLSKDFATNALKTEYGNQVNQGLLNNLENPNSFYAKNLAAAVATDNPDAYLSSVGYNQSVVDQMTDYYDAKVLAQSQYQSQQVAEGYTAQQEAQYNELVRSGMSPRDAVNQIGPAAPSTPLKVEVAGSAGYAGSPDQAIPEYRTPNTDLATQQQIDNGSAQFNAAANAWEVTPPPAAQQPIVPIITPPPPVVQPPAPNPTVPTAPVVQPPAPVAPPTPPVVQQPEEPIVPVIIPGPSTPTQPTQPTVVSSSTRTGVDGTVTKDDQMSDGSVISTIISGPSTTGGNGAPGGSTNIPEITVTAPKLPPLTPPTPVVIPPDTSYVAPVEVTPQEPVQPQEPVTPPTDPALPIVPIVPPTGPTTPEEDNYRGKYSWGTVGKVNTDLGLNPGWINPQPFYDTTNSAQSQYYWGQHPFQAGDTFDSNLYNTVPNAPAVPFGQGYAQTSATPQQILSKMGSYYPLLNNTGPVRP